MNKLLDIQNLNKIFDGVTPIKDVSFAVYGQDIVLITGENGAGKTTLFNLISGLENPTNGQVIYKGRNITHQSALRTAREGIILLYQQPRLFKNLLVWENLVSAAHNKYGKGFLNLIFKPKASKLEDEILKQNAISLLEKFGLQHLSSQKAGELSFGQQKLISFCMMVMNGVQLALLDEPFAGLNPQTIKQFSQMILQMKNEGVTFLIIEHNIDKALAIAENHIHLNEGLILHHQGIKNNVSC